MKPVFLRDVIRATPSRWLKQYAHYPENHYFPSGRSVAQIRAALPLLDVETCSADDVNAAIGNEWAELRCDRCDRNFDVLIRFGEEPDYESRWQDLCADCMTAGIEMLTWEPTENERCEGSEPD